jgi:hypothetical protein
MVPVPPLADHRDTMRVRSMQELKGACLDMQLGTGQIERRKGDRQERYEEPPTRHLVETILSTYREMPGLILHLRQAARLFGLRETTCRAVLDELVRQGRLRRAVDGQYIAA